LGTKITNGDIEGQSELCPEGSAIFEIIFGVVPNLHAPTARWWFVEAVVPFLSKPRNGYVINSLRHLNTSSYKVMLKLARDLKASWHH
jgi:hypothetical protein